MVTESCHPRRGSPRRGELPYALIRLLGMLLVAASLCGCGTLYLTQAAAGQWQVMRARRPIDTVVADPKTPPSVRDRLLDVRAARDFASTRLFLPDNRSYRTYADIERPYVVWNVVATPELSVEPKRWCFPIAGCVAYRGYFREKQARKFAAGLARHGLDAIVQGVPAYSTLGKLADPVLSSMLRYGSDELAAMVFHELAHQLLYVKNDTEFNEAFAVTVENAGLERWLTAQGHADLIARYRKEQEEERAFVTLFAQARADLARLYASSSSVEEKRAGKSMILQRLARDVRALEARYSVHFYDSWLEEGLNNAYLASLATYYDCVPGFERLLAEQGGDLPRFYGAARALSKKPRAVRHEQLCH